MSGYRDDDPSGNLTTSAEVRHNNITTQYEEKIANLRAELERKDAALRFLHDRAQSVSSYGATTGPQWVGLTTALVRARAALSPAQKEGEA